MLSQDEVTFSWDGNGNLITKSGTYGASYTWDFEDRLVGVELDDGTTVEHIYDTDGVRVRTIERPPGGSPASVTDFLVDSSGTFSQIVAETDTAGEIAEYYVRGDDLLATIRPSGIRYFHADGLGSIRQLSGEDNLITDSYTFGAFGELLEHQGVDRNRFLFAGEEINRATQLYYLRARWMDPITGRFASVDTFGGNFGEPSSLHKYIYSAGDPVNRRDPSGHETLGGLLASFSIQAIAARAFVGAILGAGDAFFRGYSTTSGIAFGAAAGILGPLLPLKVGIGFAVFGVGEALYHSDYDSALYRAATFGFGYILQTRGFSSFAAFKRFWGPAGRGRAWHHIVEQTPANQASFAAEQLHNPSNMVPLGHGKGSIHAKISGFYSSKQPRISGSTTQTIRQWLSTKSFDEQYQFGLETLVRFGGSGSPINVSGWSTSWFWPAVLEPFSEDESIANGFGQDGETP